MDAVSKLLLMQSYIPTGLRGSRFHYEFGCFHGAELQFICLLLFPLLGDHKHPHLEMCGCRTSVPSIKQDSVNQPAPASTKKDPLAAAGMPKGVPIAKQLTSIQALRKGSDLEKAFATAALVYNNYADPKGKLSKAETKSLLQSQFWHVIQKNEYRCGHNNLNGKIEKYINTYIGPRKQTKVPGNNFLLG
ncbi:sentan isoform X4 [Aphelocoma coerulescens]|uniref:sentan isoform X4 n=1 Tax=Aphelocoma coerulescens TaxID=39617 RepID=UPI0036054586